MSPLRKSVMLGTAGHVDHGKTALVKLLTGCDTDTLAEEKSRGLTIDLGFAPCRMADQRIVGIVDVPGHVDFIRNMVAGAHGVDVVIFVVAADDGIMPQTREHLHILSLMGVRHGVVALTKIDLIEPARRAEIIINLQELLASTFLAGAPVCPVSNVTGEGFDGFFEALNRVVDACHERPASGYFRLWVEDVFAIKGAGTVVTGIPMSGTVACGDSLTLLPTGATAHVRTMQVYGQNAPNARAGECVALNLPGLDHSLVKRGMVLCQLEAAGPVSMAEGTVQVLPDLPCPVKDLLDVQLHVGTAFCTARLALLEHDELPRGQGGMVQLRLSESLPLLPGDRFILRANVGHQGLLTLGGGRILAISNLRLRRRKQWTLDFLRAREASISDPVLWCETLLRESAAPLSRTELGCRCFQDPASLDRAVKLLCDQSRVVELPGGTLVHSTLVAGAAAKLMSMLQEFHQANPQRAGIAKTEWFGQARLASELAEAAVAKLTASRKIETRANVCALTGWTARLSDGEQSLCNAIAAAYEKAGWAGPAPAQLALSLRQPVERIHKSIRLLVEQGVLVRLADDCWIHQRAFSAAKEIALKLFGKRPLFSTMEFRDALGVSRKYAVPILDQLDRVRFTVRTGHDRTPGVEARKLLGA